MYLMGSKWIFADFFHQMAASPTVMKVVDLAQYMGADTDWPFAVCGAACPAGQPLPEHYCYFFYFVAYPPVPGYTMGAITEGSYLWVNKTLIEFFVLLAFAALPVDLFFGADRLIKRWNEEKARAPIPALKEEGASLQRRELLRDLISVPFVGAFAYAVYRKKKWDSFEDKFLTAKPDANSGATLKSFNFASLNDLKGQVPKGKIGNLELSRLIMGGNLIGGWAHSRDFDLCIETGKKPYHSDERVMMTLQLAEQLRYRHNSM